MKHLLCALVVLLVGNVSDSFAKSCLPLHVAVPDDDVCKYLQVFPFRHQDDPQRVVENSVKDAMGANVDGSLIRSYAFVISIWNYHFDGVDPGELTAVKKDRDALIGFLKGQQFDEAVFLDNQDATPNEIRKIFTEYYLKQFISDADNHKKVRFMFIFNGHGWRPPSDEGTGALALSELASDGDYDYNHRFSLAELRGLLQDLSPYTQSMIALLGSCYAGSIFVRHPLADDYGHVPSAWIATAAPKWDEAWTLPDKSGTVFFESLIWAVNHWKSSSVQLPAADSASQAGSTIGDSTIKLHEILDRINEAHERASIDDPIKHYPPIITDALTFDASRTGAFRFIVPEKDLQIGDVDLRTAELTGSSVVGHPDISVAHSPNYYAIQGTDLSRYAGNDIDFEKFKTVGFRFVYSKLLQGSNKTDSAFVRYKADAERAGIAYGAYHFFDYCEPAETQFQNIAKALPDGAGLLPMTVDVEWNFVATGVVKRPTDCSSIDSVRAELKKLLDMIEAKYGKTPVIYTATAFMKQYPILDESFDKYPLWLADFSPSAKAVRAPRLPGKNPWTFWQAAGDAHFPEIPGKSLDLNVFFGSEAQFAAFAAGRGNVALEAALRTHPVQNTK